MEEFTRIRDPREDMKSLGSTFRAFKSLPKWKRVILFKVVCSTVDGQSVRTSTREIQTRMVPTATEVK